MSEANQTQLKAVADLSYCGWPTGRIASLLGLSQRRVQQILQANEELKQGVRRQFDEFNERCEKLA